MLFLRGERRIMAATSAFGMGVDKTDVNLVVHFNLPLSLVDYYQQAGRAGRAGQKAKCVLLYCEDDYHVNRVILTYSAGMVLTYKQFQRIWDACSKTESIQDNSNPWKKKEKLYCSAFQEQGLKVYLNGKPGKLYRLRIQIEPCRVLGEQDPTALFRPDKKACKELVKAADRLLKKLKTPASVDDMKISRCDLTINILFSSREELLEYLRILKKSLIIPCYNHVFFEKMTGRQRTIKPPMPIRTVFPARVPVF